MPRSQPDFIIHLDLWSFDIDQQPPPGLLALVVPGLLSDLQLRASSPCTCINNYPAKKKGYWPATSFSPPFYAPHLFLTQTRHHKVSTSEIITFIFYVYLSQQFSQFLSKFIHAACYGSCDFTILPFIIYYLTSYHLFFT